MVESVLLVCNTVYPYFRGGYEVRYYEIARRLSKRGIKVTLLTACPRNYEIGSLKILRVYYFDSFFEGNLRSIRREFVFSLNLLRKYLSRELLREKYDIIDINQTPPLHIIPTFVFSRIKRSALVCTIHEELSIYITSYIKHKVRDLGRVSSLLSIIAKGVYKHVIKKLCDCYITVSENVARALIEFLHIPPETVYVVPNGIDLKKIHRYFVYRKHKDNNFVITFIGRLVSEKRPHWLVYLTKYLVNLGFNDIKTQIIGHGPLITFIKKLIEKLNLEKYVKLYYNLSDQLKFKLLAVSDLFVLPSLREGFSIATLEAMALGNVPILTCKRPELSGICGYLDFVIDGYNGYIANSYDNLLNKVVMLINNRDLLNEMSRRAILTAQRYDWEKIIDRLICVYSRLCD